MAIYMNTNGNCKEKKKGTATSIIPSYIIKVKCLNSGMPIPFFVTDQVSNTSIAKIVVLETLNK